MILSKLNIGFNSTAELTDCQTYTIKGDISAQIEDEETGVKRRIDIDKVEVVFNHDGLFKDTVVDGKTDADRVFRFTELHSEEQHFDLEDVEDNGEYDYCVPMHGDNALNIYAYFDCFYY